MNAEVDSKPKAVISVTPAAYNALVAATWLQDIRLIKSEFSLNPEGMQHEGEWKLSQTCEIQHAHFEADTKMLMAWVGAEATCKWKGKKIAAFRCRYLIVYGVHGTPEESAVDTFAKRVARFAAYPYFRSHVAEVACQAGLRLPPLPVIKETRLIPRDKAIPRKAD